MYSIDVSSTVEKSERFHSGDVIFVKILPEFINLGLTETEILNNVTFQ